MSELYNRYKNIAEIVGEYCEDKEGKKISRMKIIGLLNIIINDYEIEDENIVSYVLTEFFSYRITEEIKSSTDNRYPQISDEELLYLTINRYNIDNDLPYKPFPNLNTVEEMKKIEKDIGFTFRSNISREFTRRKINKY